MVATAAALWGTIGVAARAAYAAGMTPAALVTVRMAAAALVLWGSLRAVRPQLLRVPLRDGALLGLYGLVNVAGFNLLFFKALHAIPVAAASVLLYTAPAFTAVAARVLFREPLTPAKVLAVLLTLAGCGLVAEAYRPEVWRVRGEGLLAGLGAGMVYSLYALFGKHATARYSPWTVLACSLAGGSVTLLLLAGAEAWAARWALLRAWPAVAYMVLASTLTAHSLYLAGLRRIPASHAGVVATVEPVVAAMVGSALLGEPVGPVRAAGIGLVLAGVALLSRSPEPSGPPELPLPAPAGPEAGGGEAWSARRCT